MAAIGVLKTVFGTTAEITVHKPDVVVGPELRVSGASAYLRNDAYKAKDQEYMEAGWFDFQTGNWWLAYGGDKKPIGYWAKETFNHMDKGAGRVSWGGMVVSPSNEKTPAMGSGHFPSEGFRQSAYVSYPRYVDGDNNLQKPDEDWTYRLVDNADCYDADKLSPKVVNGFFYGGPAGCKD
ncbi:hypothetical protein LUZ60_004807 [Juncus effusus]|nr:hypothetical protein LUZ60_004807 [Juncus effusus]